MTLWTYKCFMLVLFQNKIIYMPSVPPFSRSEKIEDYAAHCRSVRWQEKRIKSADGVEIALAVAGIHGSKGESNPEIAPKHVAIIYFQGCVPP